MPNQPEYVTALQSAASAYMQGLQNREAREQRERERAQEVEQQRKNFLLNFQSRQAEAGNVGAARQLDTEFGLTPQIPAGFGALLPKPNQVTNPQALNDAQRKLMGAVSSMQGMPAPESPHFYQEHAAFSPNESQALQQGQQAFEQQNLAGLTGLSQGKSSPAFQGAFEQFAQQQQVKQQQALEQRQAETKRAQDEKYFEDQDRLILDGRASPANANKYFQAKRDYLAGKTTELPTLEIREKLESSSGESRAERERNRRTATLLTALSHTDTAVQNVNDSIKQEYDAWSQFSKENTDPRLLDARSDAFIKRTKELENKRKGYEKRQSDLSKILETLMAEEGLPAAGFADEVKVSKEDQIVEKRKQGALRLYLALLKLGQSADYARNESIRRFSYDPTTDYLNYGMTPGSISPASSVSAPESVANQALQGTEDKASRAKALLDQAGYESDETAVKLFLQNNPNF